LIGDKVRVGRAYLSMFLVVVAWTIAHVTGQFPWQICRGVTREEIYDMVGDECRKPAHLRICARQVVRNITGRRTHHMELRPVASGLLAAFTHKVEAPFDQMRIGKL